MFNQSQISLECLEGPGMTLVRALEGPATAGPGVDTVAAEGPMSSLGVDTVAVDGPLHVKLMNSGKEPELIELIASMSSEALPLTFSDGSMSAIIVASGPTGCCKPAMVEHPSHEDGPG